MMWSIAGAVRCSVEVAYKYLDMKRHGCPTIYTAIQASLLHYAEWMPTQSAIYPDLDRVEIPTEAGHP
jgi:hypothetical protein